MSEMKEIHTYLKKTLEKLEKNNEQLPSEIISQAEAFANTLEYGDLLDLSSLQEPYKKDTFTDPARIAYITNLALLFIAKKCFENGEIKKTIDVLFTYHFQLGQIDQNLTEVCGFREKEAKRSKAGTDKRYGPDRTVREEVCKLLHEHKPTNGWKDRPEAVKKILPYAREFHTNNLSGSNIKPENLESNIKKWLENSKYEPHAAFNETASQNWINYSDEAKKRRR